MTIPRYAVYFVPSAESDLYRFGSAVIGYDCYCGADIPRLGDLESNVPDWGEVTREPRTYGFHATLKAPFRLVASAGERDLRAQLDRLAAQFVVAPVFTPRVSLLGRFVAIVPDRLPGLLADLANACVEEFEPLRAPLTPEERQRRVAAGLDPRQIASLDRWGYPYVFSDFRFHMTLTGALGADRGGDIQARLSSLFDKATGGKAIVVDRLALLRQHAPGDRFEVMRVAPLGCAMSEAGLVSPRG
jgi:hypothetical protein